MDEKLKKAVDRVLFLHRDQNYKMPYAIGIVANETGISKKDLAAALAKRRWQKKEIQDIKRTLNQKKRNPFYPVKEKCRECGTELSYGQDKCPLCNADTGWIFDIAEGVHEI
jgi:hypothetical protein